MKKFLLILALFSCIACNRHPKNFSTVKIGMTKEQVVSTVGEPAKKNDMGIEIWVYPQADRTVVFRNDTVYSIITSAEARMDSIKMSLEKAGQKVEKSIQKLGKDMDSSAEKIKKDLDTLKKKKK
jgi:hypothetical protein